MNKPPLEVRPHASPEEVEKVRKASVQKWRKEAVDFFASEQYELARDSIEKIYAWSRGETDLFGLAADIYSHCGDFSAALHYIERAIRIKPDNTMYLIIKAECLCKQGETNLARDILDSALTAAERQGDRCARGEALALYAYLLYHYVPFDKTRAKQYIEEAATLGASRELARSMIEQYTQEKEAEVQKQLQNQALAEERKKNEELNRQKVIVAQNKKKQIAAKRQQIKVMYVVSHIVFWICTVRGYNLVFTTGGSSAPVVGKARFLVVLVCFLFASAFLKYQNVLYGETQYRGAGTLDFVVDLIPLLDLLNCNFYYIDLLLNLVGLPLSIFLFYIGVLPSDSLPDSSQIVLLIPIVYWVILKISGNKAIDDAISMGISSDQR